MGDPNKLFASLSPRLLARKGGAKPAMRPQVQPLSEFQVDLSPASQDDKDWNDDLGWNDMGADHDSDESPCEDADACSGTDDGAEVVAICGAGPASAAQTPPVVAQQQDILARLDRRGAPALRLGERRAAFTLRIEPQRHLELRLASTVTGRSAQSLLTEALDRMLEDMPEIRSLAENVRKRS